MTLTMKALAGSEIEKLFAEPQLAFDLLFPEDDDALDDPSLIDLDKAWHGIHYLLTGTAWEGEPPLNALVVGGASLPDPDEEWTYAPPRVLRPADVHRLNDALEALPDEQLANRFDPGDMTAKEIYPEVIWDRDPREDDALGYLMEYVTVLRDFIRAVASKNDGVLVALV
jgi:hypothetical protein